MTDRVGQHLGNYRLLRLLGRGGFAEVYLGEHVSLKTYAALKLLHARLTDEDAEHFLQEAQTLAHLSHPHIVRVLDFAVQDGTPFLVMEYAPGGTLRQRHPKEAPLPLETIVSYVRQVASALQYAHDQRLIHRDVKPENMLLNAREEVVLSDFGLAMLAPSTRSSGSTEEMGQPPVGTTPYLAPEQLQGKAQTASDQYALGIVTYEWLCGKRPFSGSPIEIAMQHLSAPPLPLRQLRPDLSHALEQVVLRALAKDPKDRFATVQEFAATLVAAQQAKPLSSIPALHISLLGEFQLVLGETPMTTIDWPRLQSLLAYLLLHRTRPQARSSLAYLLWPDSTDSQAHTNLRQLVHRLRHTLHHADRFVRIEKQTLQWQPAASWTLDVADFEQALVQAEQAEQVHDQTAARQALEQAIEAYRGDLLPSCYDEWILPERERLRQLFLAALERLLLLLEREGNSPAAIGAAQRLLRYDPLHEATYRHLMRLYAASGDRAAALRTYHTCVTVLERELAAEPAAATKAAYERLLQKEEPSSLPVAPPLISVAAAPLLGRQQEWERLQQAWQKALVGEPHLVVLAGEAGIGKTRLAEELLAWVSRQGIRTASARCYAAEGELAYAPVATWLSTEALRKALPQLADVWLTEVARLVPDVLGERPQLPRPGPLTESWQRQRLFEALGRAMLAGRQPLLLLLDDLQWCDRETLEWLHYFLRFDQHARLLLISTVRLEEIVAEHPVKTLVAALQRDGQLTEIPLGPLDEATTAALAVHGIGRNLDLTEADALYRETEGNPLFVIEIVRAGVLEQQGTELQSSAGMSPSPGSLLPATVQAVIAARLAQLSLHAREVVSLAAVIGRAFTFTLLAQASGSDEDVLVRGLDELWQRRIVREQGGDAYDFSHDKLREATYASLSQARRRLLHRRMFEALQAMAAPAAQLAHHALHAGLVEQTFRYSLAAGDDAMRLFAVRDAITHYEQAQQVVTGQAADGHDQHRTLPVVQIHHLYVQLGRAYEFKGDYQKAHRVYETMLTFAREEHEPRMECAALNRLATLASWAFDMRTATTLLREALTVAERSGNTVGLAETEWGLAQVSYYASDAKEALLHAERALALAHERDLKELIAHSLNVLAHIYELLGNWEEVAARTRQARAFYAALGNRAMEVDCLSALARAQVMSGHPQEGVGTARIAHAISVETENAWGQTYSACQLALGLAESGAYTEALSFSQQSVTLARTIG